MFEKELNQSENSFDKLRKFQEDVKSPGIMHKVTGNKYI